MKKFNINMTSTRSLVVFESAARLGSFSRAANELHIGQPAVSHSVRQLEEMLNASLFYRRHRGVELTESGQRLATKVSAAIHLIREGLEQVARIDNQTEVLTLTVSTSLAGFWLMPRLARFKFQHPNVEIRCITRDNDVDLRRDDFDLCIPLGSGPWPGFTAWMFTEEEILPVCSPDYLDDIGSGGLENLRHARLLHLEERYRKRFSWSDWFDHFEIDHVNVSQGAISNDYSIVIQSAMEGQGVALGWRHIVSSLLEQKLLVPATEESVLTGNPFHIISPPDRARLPGVVALREWLVHEAA